MRFILRPLIGPQITRSVQGLSLVNPPPSPKFFFFFLDLSFSGGGDGGRGEKSVGASICIG